MDAGTLYIVSTPIGNLEDITFRAITVLKNCGLVISEDTRETDKILKHYQLTARQISYRDQNHVRVYGQILEELKNGINIALVSDSGTPLISDPGFKLVSELAKAGINIESIPGPSSVISSISVSGLPTDKFTFLGFLPKSKGQRSAMLKEYCALETTVIIFESPFRVKKLLEEIQSEVGNRFICVVKDQTKVFEKILRSCVAEVINQIPDNPKGEYIVLIAKEGYSF